MGKYDTFVAAITQAINDQDPDSLHQNLLAFGKEIQKDYPNKTLTAISKLLYTDIRYKDYEDDDFPYESGTIYINSAHELSGIDLGVNLNLIDLSELNLPDPLDYDTFDTKRSEILASLNPELNELPNDEGLVYLDALADALDFRSYLMRKDELDQRYPLPNFQTIRSEYETSQQELNTLDFGYKAYMALLGIHKVSPAMESKRPNREDYSQGDEGERQYKTELNQYNAKKEPLTKEIKTKFPSIEQYNQEVIEADLPEDEQQRLKLSGYCQLYKEYHF